MRGTRGGHACSALLALKEGRATGTKDALRGRGSLLKCLAHLHTDLVPAKLGVAGRGLRWEHVPLLFLDFIPTRETLIIKCQSRMYVWT